MAAAAERKIVIIQIDAKDFPEHRELGTDLPRQCVVIDLPLYGVTAHLFDQSVSNAFIPDVVVMRDQLLTKFNNTEAAVSADKVYIYFPTNAETALVPSKKVFADRCAVFSRATPETIGDMLDMVVPVYMASLSMATRQACINELLSSKSELSLAELGEVCNGFTSALAGTELMVELIKLAAKEGFANHVSEIKKFLMPIFAAADFSEVSFKSLHNFVKYFANTFFDKTSVDQLQAIRHLVGAILVTYIDKAEPGNLSDMMKWHESGYSEMGRAIISKFIMSRIDPISYASYLRGSDGTTTTDFEVGAALAKKCSYANPVVESLARRAHRRSFTFAAQALSAVAGAFAHGSSRSSADVSGSDSGVAVELQDIASKGANAGAGQPSLG